MGRWRGPELDGYRSGADDALSAPWAWSIPDAEYLGSVAAHDEPEAGLDRAS
jgi:hypothetical protein